MLLFACVLYAVIQPRVSHCLEVTDLSSSNWTLSNNALDINIPASFPSYAHLDLAANQVTGELEYGLNDFSLRWIWQQNWTYTTTVQDLSTDERQSFLIFQGLDTFATIELCGQHVAHTNNQFRQYYFNVTDVLAACNHDVVLSLNFGSAPNIVAAIANEAGQEQWPFGVELAYEIPNRQFMRKQQNDFGWDWGPAYAPAGPWQPAYVVQIEDEELYARNVDIDVYRYGQRNNLIPEQNQPWTLNASIDVIGIIPATASLVYILQDDTNRTVLSGSLTNITQVNNAISGATSIDAGAVNLWWPVGMGSQTLYNLTIAVQDGQNTTICTVNRRIGFRTIVLNELPVSDEDIALGVAPGNNWHFEINGHAFFAKGSNFIPPDVFWPRVTPSSIRTLFDNVVAGNQNMLRVWSSGAYSPDFMYDLADEMGILLWSEFEFGDSLYPVDQDFLDNVYEEAVYQVRRINHHPSLAYWAGGNELENLELVLVNGSDPSTYTRYKEEYEHLFLTTLFPAVFENSRSVSYAPSSTSNGFISLNFTDAPYMQERYEDLVSGSIYGETDYYNYDSALAFNFSSYPVGRFSNEFGYHSMPSAETWQSYIPASELHFNSTTILLRNRHYPPGDLNTTNFVNSTKGMGEMTIAAQRWYPTPNKSDSVANFSAWCWTTQVFQADYYASQIQFYRRGSGLRQRTLGSLYWQLEDQWAAPTWAGIDRNGRWKVLHYKAKDVYQNVIISPFFSVDDGGALEVWVTSDLWTMANATVEGSWMTYTGSILNTTNLNGLVVDRKNLSIGALNSTVVYNFTDFSSLLTANKLNASDLVLRLNVTATGLLPQSNRTTSFQHTNWFHASPLSAAALVDPGLILTHNDKSSEFTITATTGVSAWTWLEYPAGAVVTFSENGFWLAKGEQKTISYNVTGDSTNGAWISGVVVGSLWNNTLV